MNIELVIQSDTPRGSKRIPLRTNDEWNGGLEGKFMTPLEEELPVNNLFLVLENIEDADEYLVRSLEDLADQDQDHILALHVTKDDGNEMTIPIRSVSFGKNSISLYRQSVHQTLDIA